MIPALVAELGNVQAAALRLGVSGGTISKYKKKLGLTRHIKLNCNALARRQIEEIFALLRKGFTRMEVAEMFGVTKEAIGYHARKAK